MNFPIKIILIFFMIFITNCAEKTYNSGKILNPKIDFNSFNNKDDLINNLGNPSFIDPIENKYYYFSENLLFKNLESC